jgi:predicted Zn-ribbon and HTH transcriptional regulator
MSDERSTTIRQAITAALTGQELTALELSQRVGVPEREVASHLSHLERSLAHSRQKLELIPPSCIECNFVFHKRDKKTRPSRCAVCKSERLRPPRFRIG